MADKNPRGEDSNLIDLSQERQRLEQKREREARAKKLTRTSKHSDRVSGPIRWYHYLQLVIFLCLFAYFMSRCKGG